MNKNKQKLPDTGCSVSVCPMGEFRNPGSGNCTLCANGTYKGEYGDEECSLCEDGTITLQEGSTQCGQLSIKNFLLNFNAKTFKQRFKVFIASNPPEGTLGLTWH